MVSCTYYFGQYEWWGWVVSKTKEKEADIIKKTKAKEAGMVSGTLQKGGGWAGRGGWPQATGGYAATVL